jgi:hypothetical protein
MRISRIFGAALLAAVLTLAARPQPASAQFTVSRTETATANRDSVQRAAFDGVHQDMLALFDAQRAFFGRHGRFATEMGELAGFQLRPTSSIRLTAGPDWYVALGGDANIGVVQYVVRHATAPAEHTAKAEGSGAAAPR